MYKIQDHQRECKICGIELDCDVETAQTHMKIHMIELTRLHTTQHVDVPPETLNTDDDGKTEKEADPTQDTVPVDTDNTGHDTGQPAAGHTRKRIKIMKKLACQAKKKNTNPHSGKNLQINQLNTAVQNWTASPHTTPPFKT